MRKKNVRPAIGRRGRNRTGRRVPPRCRAKVALMGAKGARSIGSRSRWILAISIACTVSCLGWVLGSASGAGPFRASEDWSRSQASEPFPLSKVVPTEAFVVLGKGRVRQSQWGAFAYRSRAGMPCVVVASFFYGPNSGGNGVSYLPGSPDCGKPIPLGAQPLESSSGVIFRRDLDTPTVGAEALAMVFGKEVSRVKIGLRPGPSQGRRTQLLRPAQASKAGVQPFSYVAFSVARSVCVEQVTGFDAAGAQLFQTAPRLCK
jgi:hypothetical protein